MWLSISARFTLKGKPEGYLGLCGYHKTWGRDKHISLSELAICALIDIFNWHTVWLDGETMNAEIQKVVEFLQKLNFVDTEEGV